MTLLNICQPGYRFGMLGHACFLCWTKLLKLTVISPPRLQSSPQGHTQAALRVRKYPTLTRLTAS